jgi:hypothetical protein
MGNQYRDFCSDTDSCEFFILSDGWLLTEDVRPFFYQNIIPPPGLIFSKYFPILPVNKTIS